MRTGAAALRRASVGCLVVGACVARPPRESRTVFFASGADLQSINSLIAVHPLAKQVQKHVLFLTLASYDSLLDAVPRLAQWEWSLGHRALTFHLRRDVTWHDGTPTTSDDVVWTLEMARHPRVAYPRAAEMSDILAIERVDSFTVRVQFGRPQPRFPDVLTDLAILPRHRLGAVPPGEIRAAPFNLAPVGNGPFEFVEYQPNQRWLFRRFEGFPEQLQPARFDRFVIAVVDEAATKLAALTSGELDFAGINPAHASFVRQDPRLMVLDYPLLLVYGLIWNLRRAPFDDPALRRALTMGIDRELLVEAYLYGFGTVAHGPVSPNHPWFEEPEAVPYDPRAAAARLDDLEWTLGSDGVRRKGNRPLRLQLLTVAVGDNALEQMIQAQLRAIGVEVRIRRLEMVSFLETAQGPAREFDALVTGIPGDLSLGYVAALFGSRNPGPLAYAGYQSPAFERALRRAGEAHTEAEQEMAWREAQRVLARDGPVTWLYHARGVQGVNRRVRSVHMDLRGELAGIASWVLRPEGGR